MFVKSRNQVNNIKNRYIDKSGYTMVVACSYIGYGTAI